MKDMLHNFQQLHKVDQYQLLFDQLRDLAVSQNILSINGVKQAESASNKPYMHYYILGYRVCRKAFARLMGVGWYPRLAKIQQAVLEGRARAPADMRYLLRPSTAPACKWGEIHSYLESLDQSVAETLPHDHSEQDEASDEYADMKVAVEAGVLSVAGADSSATRDQLKFLPPGSVFEQWRQYCAVAGCSVSFRWFWRVSVTDFGHKLTFRSGFMHSVCPICVKHKLIIRNIAHDARARCRQRILYDRHLQSQYEDRNNTGS